MRQILTALFFFFVVHSFWGQKDSLELGSSYADDQIYASITYAQLTRQPNTITRSGFSYGVSAGFIKDLILNKSGSFSLGLGVGYGYLNVGHLLRVEEINGSTVFGNAVGISDNEFSTHSVEFPLEFRWRTSSANRYDFWRIYSGVKILYNVKNTFEFTENANRVRSQNISAFNNLQYGLTLSVGYGSFNAHVFYGLTSMYDGATFNNQPIDTRILKYGIVFYIL